MSNEELALKIQNGDNSVIPQLWEQVERFIYKLALKWAGAYNRPDITVEDLYQSGYFALLDAVQRFEYGRGDFLTVLSFSLKTAFSDALKWRSNRPPQDASFYCVSLNAPIQGVEDATLEDNIPDDHDVFEDVEERLYQEYVSKTCHKAVDSLSNRQKEFIELHFFNNMTQKDIAAQQGISFQRVRQIIVDGLRHIRNGSFSPELEKIYYSSCNYYRGVGTSAFKRANTSSVERELLRKERFERRYGEASKKLSREKKIALLVDYMDYSPEFAEWMVDNDPDHDYSKLLLLKQLTESA